MKSRSISPLIFFVLLVTTAVLAGCELRADRSDPVQLDAPPQTDPGVVDPNLVLTVDPNLQPAATLAAPDMTLTPDAVTGETPAAGGETTGGETGQPAAGGETTGGENAGTTDGQTQPRQTVVHVVKSGDTLGQIAQQYDVSIAEIAAANNLVNIDSLAVGQEITIPGDDFVAPEPAATTEGQVTTGETPATGEQQHIVAAGQTLYSIGLRYGFTVAELQAYNNITNPNVLDVGQVIKIPPSE